MSLDRIPKEIDKILPSRVNPPIPLSKEPSGGAIQARVCTRLPQNCQPFSVAEPAKDKNICHIVYLCPAANGGNHDAQSGS